LNFFDDDERNDLFFFEVVLFVEEDFMLNAREVFDVLLLL
jgi:hypothetical protein